MRRTLFALFTAFALVLAMPVAAQQEEGQKPEAYETRTNPGADSSAGNSGLTLTGTVVEWNEQQLTLKTTTGVEHIQLVPRTDRPVELENGQGVSVDYTRSGQGVMIAQKIRPEGEMAEAGVKTTQTATSDLTAETEAETEADTESDTERRADVETEGEVETDVTTELDTDVETTTAETDRRDTYGQETDTLERETDELPATGSELPLMALLGLLSVAAAFGVRSFLR